MGIVPDRIVPVRARHLAARNRVAVAEEDRCLLARGFDPGGEDRQHIRTVEVVGDPTEALRLALRAIGRARSVEPHQLRVGGGVEHGLGRQRERALRRGLDRQALGRDEGRREIEVDPVEPDRHGHELVAVEMQRRAGLALRIGPQFERRADARRRGVKQDIERDRLDEVIGRAVIGEADRLGLVATHRRHSFSDHLSRGTAPHSPGRIAASGVSKVSAAASELGSLR